MPLPEVWFSTRERRSDSTGVGTWWVASGFATGDFALALTEQRQGQPQGQRLQSDADHATEALLRQLATILPPVLLASAQGQGGHHAQGQQAQAQQLAQGQQPAQRQQLDESSADYNVHSRANSADADQMLSTLRARLCHAEVMDWQSEPWALGGYSAPSFGEAVGARAAYRQPACDGRVAFCGEATEDACMTMSAAIESGRRAARQVMARLQQQ